MKEVINKQVYCLVAKTEFSFSLDKSKKYTITKIISGGERNDWCDHYVIRAKGEAPVEVRSCEVVFIPDTTLPEDLMIDKYLNDNECYHDEVYHSGGKLWVYITWGDWKHSFGWLDNLMRYLGYTRTDEVVTEENGSDCYSAVHAFKKVTA
jgi:hypothetical protein